MPRANVSSSITDESAVIPAQEVSSSLVAGIIDPDLWPNNLLGSLGFTHEWEQGYMTISSVGEYHQRLKSNAPTAIGPYDIELEYSGSYEGLPFLHLNAPNGSYVAGDIFAGGTFERWPFGSQEQPWSYMWNIIENYLQYGGQITVFSSKSTSETKTEVLSRAKNKKIPLDIFISPFHLENDDIRSVVNYRQDCIAITSVPSEHKAGVLRTFGAGGPSPNPSPGEEFFRGATFNLFNYDPTPLGEAEGEFDRVFFGNTGNTYRYESARAVYSVVVRDDRPRQEYLGSTTDVVNWERYRSVYEYETFSHYRGYTFDISVASAQAMGATFGGGTNDSPPSGAVTYYNPDAQFIYAANGIQPETIDANPEEFLNYQNHKKNNIKFFANPHFKTKMGDALISFRCINLEDLPSKSLLDVAPTIVKYPNANPFLVTATYQTFMHIAVPSNYMDKFSYKFADADKALNGSIALKHPGQAISCFMFAGDQGGGTRSWELIPHPTNPGETIRTGFPAADVKAEAPLSWSETRSSALIDLRKTFDPEFDFLDNLYGPSGLDPRPDLYDLYQQARNLTISGFGSPGGTFAEQTIPLKEIYNIFDHIKGPTSETDVNGNTPLDFWGCTCSRIPEYLNTFNLTGVTPDICIEVGPNSRTQDVTADGSTYTAYVGWSNPVPNVGIKPLVNIFGEIIGAGPGTTYSNLLITKFDNIGEEIVTVSNQYGQTDSVLAKSLVFYPLIENTSFNDESPIGSGNYPLIRDENNFYAVPVYRTDQNFNYRAGVSPVHAMAPHQDSNHALYEEFFESPLTEYVDTGYHPAAIQFNRLVNQSPNGELQSFIGTQLTNPIVEVGNVGASYEELFWLGFSGGSTLYGQGLTFDGYDGIYLVAEVDVVPGIPSLGFAPSDYELDVTDFTYNNIFSSNADLYEFPVFGEKYSTDSFENYSSEEDSKNISKSNEIPFTSDVAGVFARQFRDLQPWFSPANQRVSSITDIIAERYHLSNAEQDDIYDNKINFIKNLDGSLRLFGDKTFADSTSTFSRVNVANLFIYLKKKFEPLGRRLFFEPNDEKSRQLFISTAEPFLETLRGQRAISDFRVVCDETNNTPDVIDSNQFVVDIFIKPTKTINFIKLRITNVGTSFELE